MSKHQMLAKGLSGARDLLHRSLDILKPKHVGENGLAVAFAECGKAFEEFPIDQIDNEYYRQFAISIMRRIKCTRIDDPSRAGQYLLRASMAEGVHEEFKVELEVLLEWFDSKFLPGS
jgi:hypothetical protein